MQINYKNLKKRPIYLYNCKIIITFAAAKDACGHFEL